MVVVSACPVCCHMMFLPDTCLSLLLRAVASIICLLEYSFTLCFTFCFTLFARHFTISSSFIWYFDTSSFCNLVFHGSDFIVVFWLPSFLFDFSMYIICLSFIMSVAVGIFVSRFISSWDVVGRKALYMELFF